MLEIIGVIGFVLTGVAGLLMGIYKAGKLIIKIREGNLR